MRRLDFPFTTFPVMASLLVACLAGCTRNSGRAAATPPPVTTASPVSGSQRSVLLFFADPDGQGLVARRADVVAAPDPGTLAAEALAALLRGPAALPAASPVNTPAPNVSPIAPPIAAIPDGVELRAVFLDGKGTATVDLGHLAERVGGGTEAEVLALWSIVDTLAFNFPADARRVRILLDGHEVETLGGHVALDTPLAPRRDLVIGDLPVAGAAPGGAALPTETAPGTP